MTHPDSFVVPFTATASAPCKINLTLDVFAPRTDGFHDLASLVIPMAYPADTVTVSMKRDPNDEPTSITLTCDDPTLPTDEKNLAFRAARDFAQAFLPAYGLQIHVDLVKRLPHQAGLGGGSSDAATVLRLLCRHYIDGLPDGYRNPMNRLRVMGILKPLAARIGSDVPLFLPGMAVTMEGRGEKVRGLSCELPPIFGVIVKPDVGVSTGFAFALLDDLRQQKDTGEVKSRFEGQKKSTILWWNLHERRIGSAIELGPFLSNDFEQAVLSAYPEVERAHQAVQEAGAVRALLCGSGSAVFGLARNRDHARQLSNALLRHWPWVAETSTLPSAEPATEMETQSDG